MDIKENKQLIQQRLLKAILIWKFYYGYPTKKIAEILGLKENTVDQKVKRGLEKLKKTLEGGGFYEG